MYGLSFGRTDGRTDGKEIPPLFYRTFDIHVANVVVVVVVVPVVVVVAVVFVCLSLRLLVGWNRRVP